MSLKSLMSVAAAALCLSAAPALAQSSDPVLAAFQSICVDTDGRADTTMARLDAAGGWQVLPPEMMGEQLPFDDLQARIRFTDSGMALVMTGTMTEGMDDMFAPSGAEVVMPVCAVGVMPGDYAAADDAVSAWLGTSAHPAMIRPDMKGYAFVIDQDGSRIPVAVDASDDEMVALVQTGAMRLVLVGDSQGMVMLMLMRPESH